MRLPWRNAMAAVLLLVLGAGLSAAEDTRAQVLQKLDREANAIKRAELRMKLAQFELDDAKKFYEEGASDKGLASLKKMMSLIEQAEEGLFATGHDPRKKPRGFKQMEIKLREMHRRVEDLVLTVPLEDRPPVKRVLNNIADIHEELLHGIMRVKEPTP